MTMSSYSTTRASAERLQTAATALVREAMELADKGRSTALHIGAIARELPKHGATVKAAVERLLSSLRAG
jgi:hypothetical protein